MIKEVPSFHLLVRSDYCFRSPSFCCRLRGTTAFLTGFHVTPHFVYPVDLSYVCSYSANSSPRGHYFFPVGVLSYICIRSVMYFETAFVMTYDPFYFGKSSAYFVSTPPLFLHRSCPSLLALITSSQTMPFLLLEPKLQRQHHTSFQHILSSN